MPEPKIPSYLSCPEAHTIVVFSGKEKKMSYGLRWFPEAVDYMAEKEARKKGCIHYHSIPHGLSVWPKDISRSLSDSFWHNIARFFAPYFYESEFINVSHYELISEFYVTEKDIADYSCITGDVSLDNLISKRLGEEFKGIMVANAVNVSSKVPMFYGSLNFFGDAGNFNSDGIFTLMSEEDIPIPETIDDHSQEPLLQCKIFNRTFRSSVNLIESRNKMLKKYVHLS